MLVLPLNQREKRRKELLLKEKKEAELKMRLETLLMKRRAAATRVLPDSNEDIATKDHVEWSAVEEGFHLLERDLGKLQARPSFTLRSSHA